MRYTRRNSAIFLKRLAHFGQISHCGSWTNMFVRINRDVAFAGRLDDLNDLLSEASGFNRFRRARMGFFGK